MMKQKPRPRHSILTHPRESWNGNSWKVLTKEMFAPALNHGKWILPNANLMKNKPVDLYVDLYPNWHERKESEMFLFAMTNPSAKSSGCIRVKITVELPEYPVEQHQDYSRTGTATLTTES